MEKIYGKPYSNELLKIKSSFYNENDVLLKERVRANAIYNQQPIRKNCKMCGKPLDGMNHFKSHEVLYYFCDNCHHLNGGHEETADFCEHIYVEEDYGKEYLENEIIAFHERTQNIYIPKVDFLLKSLREDGTKDEEIHILDIGAGSGYFVNAGIMRKLDINGIEVSDKQVKFGNYMIGMEKLSVVSVTETAECISKTTCNVVSLIGVLEHLIDFKSILKAIKENKYIQYMFFSVPLFSCSCIFEAVFQEGFNRHLGGAHTHLFTLDSIDYMNREYGFQEIARWQFGTDIMDLYRLLSVSLGGNNSFLKDVLDEKFLACADEFQFILDKNDFCSEVHMLVKK